MSAHQSSDPKPVRRMINAEQNASKYNNADNQKYRALKGHCKNPLLKSPASRADGAVNIGPNPGRNNPLRNRLIVPWPNAHLLIAHQRASMYECCWCRASTFPTLHPAAARHAPTRPPMKRRRVPHNDDRLGVGLLLRSQYATDSRGARAQYCSHQRRNMTRLRMLQKFAGVQLLQCCQIKKSRKRGALPAFPKACAERRV